MVGLVDQAMCDGALGFSTGLFYAPQSFAKRDEVVALARAAAVKGGVYDSHIRDESSYTIGLKGAIDEALAVGRSEEHTSELQSLMRISYAVFCLKQKNFILTLSSLTTTYLTCRLLIYIM